MESHTVLLFVHVLLFVFWLGTDVGVFLAAKISEKGELSAETRSTVLGLGMVLDRLPRSALTLIVPTGLQLAVNTGRLAASDTVMLGIWAISILWLIVLWIGFLKPHTPTEQRVMLFNLAMNAIMALAVTTYAIWLLSSTDTQTWLAIKVLMVGLIFIAGVVLDVLFKPAVDVFLEIVSEGGTEERDAKYSKALGPVYWVVLSIYAFVIVAAYMGIAQPVI